MIKIGSTSKLIKGHVLDINVKHLEERLKRYDSQLYIVWNCKKRGGNGVWEVRRRPDKKTSVFQGTFNGMNLYTVEYKENNLVNHVLDVPILGYHVLDKLVSIDTTLTHNWVGNLEYAEAKAQETQETKSREDLKHWAKEHKHAIRDFKDLILSGTNPAEISKYWK